MEKIKPEEYLKTYVHPILEPLVVDLLIERPNEPLEFIKEWADKKLEYQRAQKKQVQIHTSSSQDQEPAELVPVKQPVKQPKKASRASISAQAFGMFNKKKDFQPVSYPKTPQQIERIQNIIKKSFIFNSLEPEQLKIVIGAMQERTYKPKDWVIKQYEDGQELYIVENGELNCYKQFTKGAERTFLKTYVAGESFGELSLLYNVPRQASIEAKTSCVLWSLDRATFCNIVQNSVINKRQKHDAFLKKVKLFSGMDVYEINKLGESLKMQTFKAGDYICKEKDQGDEMYLVEEGNLVATKIIDGKQKQVFEYGVGDYFGEIALLKKVPRQASIRAKTNCTLLTINKETFDRIIGTSNPVILANLAKYQGLNLKT